MLRRKIKFLSVFFIATFFSLNCFLLPSRGPGVFAGQVSFIQKIRVGLHKNTVRVVLVMDSKASRPQSGPDTTRMPVISFPGVMPGATVHRSLTVRSPSFRKYLSSIQIQYVPESRKTLLTMQFLHPVPPPSVLILSHPDRLVLDFRIRGGNGKPAPSPDHDVRGTRKSSGPRKLVIPGKNISDVPASAPSEQPGPGEHSSPHAMAAVMRSSPRKFRIILDPGHGGKDCGTRSVSGICEKTLVLDIVKRLERILARDPHFEVILTRTDDHFIPLDQRTRIANENHGDLFLSVHANADPDHSVRGIETFLLNLHSSDSRAQSIAQRENSALGVSHGDLSAILLTLKINHKKKRSWELAKQIDDNLGGTLQSHYSEVRDLGIRQAPFYVIMGTTMPAVLAEINFLSNRSDARLMDSGRFREETAIGLYRGIIAYFKSVHPETRFHGVTHLVRQELSSRVE